MSLALRLISEESLQQLLSFSSYGRELILLKIVGLAKLDYLLVSGRLFSVFSMFLLGYYAGRKSLFSSTKNNSQFFKRVLIGSFVATSVFGIFYLIVKNAAIVTDREVDAIFAVQRITQSFLYVALLVKLYELKIVEKLTAWLIPVGRMGLTVYVTQSFFLVWFFSRDPSYVLGIGLGGAMLVTASFFLLQIALALLWMSRFHYGPLEWLWRSATYLRFFPIRKR